MFVSQIQKKNYIPILNLLSIFYFINIDINIKYYMTVGFQILHKGNNNLVKRRKLV